MPLTYFVRTEAGQKVEIEDRAYVEVNLCSFVFASGATSQKKTSLHLSCACETDH